MGLLQGTTGAPAPRGTASTVLSGEGGLSHGLCMGSLWAVLGCSAWLRCGWCWGLHGCFLCGFCLSGQLREAGGGSRASVERQRRGSE